MKYKHVVEEREYKYGPEQIFKTKEELKRNLEKVRGEILTKLVLSGFGKNVKVLEDENKEGTIKLQFIITYPVYLFED